VLELPYVWLQKGVQFSTYTFASVVMSVQAHSLCQNHVKIILVYLLPV